MTSNSFFKLIILAAFFTSCSGIVQNDESIKDPKASELYNKAQKEWRNGQSGWENALNLFDEANEIEPNNPLILHERAMLKTMSKIDVYGGFVDHQAAIDCSTDSFNLKARYGNRALDYLACADICRACDDWKRATEYDKDYIKKYCQRDFTSTFNENPDTNIRITLELNSPEAFITSTHNSPSMSTCTGNVLIQNINHPTIILTNDLIDYGVEYRNKSALYLEAIDSNGTKYHFFQHSTSNAYSSNASSKIDQEEEYSKEINITQFHHFSRIGNYKVRICFRPSKRTKGLTNTYYSNWVPIEIRLK